MTTLEEELAAKQAELELEIETGSPNWKQCSVEYGTEDISKMGNFDRCMGHIGTAPAKNTALRAEIAKTLDRQNQIRKQMSEIGQRIEQEAQKQQQILHDQQISEAVATQMQMQPAAKPKTIPNEIRIILPTAEAATIDQPAYDSQLYHGKDRWTWIFYLGVFAALALIILRRSF